MSVKAVKDYYNQIVAQYTEMANDIKDFEKEVAQGIVEPELIERLQRQIEPIKQNYMTLSYIMFLLNQPQKKEKQARYAKQNKQLLEISKGRQRADLVAENNKALQSLKNLTKEQ